MDEQHDQAVLEVEEIESETDYDYLSILHEMQQSLNADANSETDSSSISQEFDSTFESAFQAVPSPPLELQTGDLPATAGHDSLTTLGETTETAEDYLANAKTQPLPQLPINFAADDLPPASLNQSADAESFTNETVADPLTFSVASASESDITPLPNFTENEMTAGLPDHAYNDFAELSPILFDASEQVEIAEPNFDADFVTSEPKIMPDMIMENSSEPAANDFSSALGDEMPTDLAFGEMFAEESVKSSVEFVPPIEIDEETEAEFTSLLEKLENEKFSETSASSGGFAEQIEEPQQNSEKQNSTDFRSELQSVKRSDDPVAINYETSAGEDDEEDFSLPETMLWEQNDFAPEEPSLAALLDFDEAATNEISQDLPPREFRADDSVKSILETPLFLQTELSAMESAKVDEELSNVLLTSETFAAAPEDAGGGRRGGGRTESLENEMGRAVDETATNNFAQPFDADSETVFSNEISFDEDVVRNKAEELPETTLFENFDFTTDSLHETAADLPENLLANSLADEVETSSAEISENVLLKTSEAEMPEVELAEFELPTVIKTGSLQFTEATSQSTRADPTSARNFNSNAHQEVSDVAKSTSFLKERFVIFKLDDTLYAFPAVNVAEIGQLLPITPLPFVPSWFLGISNLRGDILSVVGLRELWEKNTASPHKAKILVVHSEKQALTVGLVVDAVREMRHVAPEDIIFDDSFAESHSAPYQIGRVEYEGQNLCLLNAEKLLEALRS